MSKDTTQNMITLTDKIMEVEAFIEFLEDSLAGHLLPETRDKYHKQLKTAKNRLTKLEKELKKNLEEE